MPKRRVRNLDGIRIELNERERELIEQAILVNGISGIARGVGNAVGGLGLALGMVGAVIVWKEGVGWFQDKLDREREQWLTENCSQEKYDAYVGARQARWEKAAQKLGRYAPAIGDRKHQPWSYAIEHMGKDPYTFEEWEESIGPPLLFDQWCNQERASATVKRRALVGTIFPPLNLVGIAQYGFKDWFGGTK
jgi:hypothetical protein